MKIGEIFNLSTIMNQIGLIFPDDLSTNNDEIVLNSINNSDPLLLYELLMRYFLSAQAS